MSIRLPLDRCKFSRNAPMFYRWPLKLWRVAVDDNLLVFEA
jgi:hypothetical protein